VKEMMTLRIEKSSDGHRTTVRLIGRVAAENRQELDGQIEGCTERVVLDLHDVTLVDLDTVHFLAECEAAGTELLHCSPYIREWISREKCRVSKD
jgi:anti-anti-sigma regulatory factor